MFFGCSTENRFLNSLVHLKNGPSDLFQNNQQLLLQLVTLDFLSEVCITFYN